MRIGKFNGSKREIKELLALNGFKYEDYFLKPRNNVSLVVLLLLFLLVIYRILH